jgi:hypothetical protein
MARTEAQKQSQKDYMNKVRQVMVKFNTITEAEELAFLEQQGQMQTYIKELIRKDMLTKKLTNA